MKDFLDKYFDVLGLHKTDMGILYQRDVAMDPIDNDAFFLSDATQNKVKTDKEAYREDLIGFFQNKTFPISKGITSFLSGKNILSIVIDDIHDLVNFRVEGDKLMFVNTIMNVGHISNGDLQGTSNKLLEAYRKLAEENYNYVTIVATRLSDYPTLDEYQPQVIMSDDVDVRKIFHSSEMAFNQQRTAQN